MFLRLGTIIAWLALIFGALRLGAGLYVASNDDAEVRSVLAERYLGSTSSGEAIDQGLMVIVFSIALGILVKIGRSVGR